MRIGILGGTFDPIHNGHLALAEAARTQLKLGKVILVPAFIPPLGVKSDQLTAASIRYEIVRAAAKNFPDYEVSDLEIKRQGTSFTVDTLREFRQLYPSPHELFFITGGDWGRSLDQWKDIRTIFSLCTFVVAKRPGYEKMKLPPEVQFLNFCPLDISSTQIREAMRQNISVSHLVPASALAIINLRQLYKK